MYSPRRIYTKAVLWVLLAFLASGPLRNGPSAVRGLVAAAGSASSQTPANASEERDEAPGAKALDTDDALAYLHQQIAVRAAHPRIVAASSVSFASPATLALRGPVADDRAPRGPPRGAVPARAPPIS